MSDLSERKVSGPPPRTRKADQAPSRLLKANRDAAQAAQPQETQVAPTAAEPLHEAAPVPESSTVQAGRTAEPSDVALAAPSRDATEVPTPATASTVPPTANQTKKLVNATYRVPAELKQRLNSAISAVKTFEGWTSAEEYVQDLFERDIQRIQDEYNNGEPFPLRTKAMPRGRSIPPKDQ